MNLWRRIRRLASKEESSIVRFPVSGELLDLSVPYDPGGTYESAGHALKAKEKANGD
jgi:hypothetical protein